MTEDFLALLTIATIAAFVPLLVGLLRIKVAEVVLLLGAGILFGPEAIGWIQVDESIELLSELGLGLLFFLAGLELEARMVRGIGGRLAAAGWLTSLVIASAAALFLTFEGAVQDTLGVAIALTSTALGTLLPILRDQGELGTPFGRLFMGAGAWGEFGPIIAISVLLGTKSSFVALLSLVGFGLVALILATLPARLAGDRVRSILERGHRTSSQTALRFTMLLLIALLALAGTFGLDVVLGAFVAGIIVRRFSPPSEESPLQMKVEAIGFGFLIPLFFVVSGANLDIISIIENPGRLAVFFVLLLVARGLPQFFLYRSVLPDTRERARFSLLVATGLPIIVAVTALEVETGIMDPRNAAALVGAGALSVLVFPLLGNWLVRGRAVAEPSDQDRAENTA
ncbi:MAG: cation:proton antiporter [Actinomycetota bacterium]|nr:cation:proton antiporter [Actinomycetota bacterium]